MGESSGQSPKYPLFQVLPEIKALLSYIKRKFSSPWCYIPEYPLHISRNFIFYTWLRGIEGRNFPIRPVIAWSGSSQILKKPNIWSILKAVKYFPICIKNKEHYQSLELKGAWFSFKPLEQAKHLITRRIRI